MATYNFYIATTGNDTFPGTSVTLPKRTLHLLLGHINSPTYSGHTVNITIAPGNYSNDTIYQNFEFAYNVTLNITGDVFGSSFTGKSGFVQLPASIVYPVSGPMTFKNISFVNGYTIGAYYIGSTNLSPQFSLTEYTPLHPRYCIYLKGSSTGSITFDGCIFQASNSNTAAVISEMTSCPRNLTFKNCLFNMWGAREYVVTSPTQPPPWDTIRESPYHLIHLAGANVTANFYHNTFYSSGPTVTPTSNITTKTIIFSLDGRATTFTLNSKNNMFLNYSNATIYFTHYGNGTTGGFLSLTSSNNYYNRFGKQVPIDLNYHPFATTGSLGWAMYSAAKTGTTRTTYSNIDDMRSASLETDSIHGPGDYLWGSGVSFDGTADGGPRLSAGSKIYIQGNSPAADAGVYISSVDKDIWGNTRSNPPDVGCWDFTTVCAIKISGDQLAFTRNRVYIKNPSVGATHRRAVSVVNTPVSYLFALNITTDLFELPASYTNGLYNNTTIAKIV